MKAFELAQTYPLLQRRAVKLDLAALDALCAGKLLGTKDPPELTAADILANAATKPALVDDTEIGPADGGIG